MADIFSKTKRSLIMASVSSKETKPEITVRSFLFKQGFRYRKNVTSLPSKPDIVLPKYKTIILVHGCFWHGHKRCISSKLPTSNEKYWKDKITTNIDRDLRNKRILKKLGWKVIIVWECKLRNINEREKTFNKLIKNIK